MPDTIQQGTDFYVDAINIVDVSTGLPLNVTGYPVTGVARSISPRRGPILATWNTTPTGSDGTIIVGGTVPNRVRLVVSASQTATWWRMCKEVTIQAYLTDPVTALTSRIIDARYFVSFDVALADDAGFGYGAGFDWGWEGGYFS